ncbi:MAG TPA: prolipoprotein diacylglyceryl transferase family protein [Cyclobacteriaceae bacterium]|nr:prolipoprotein diacylglyceryl transferase family protein [Cyclobacteriaceae bacterium]
MILDYLIWNWSPEIFTYKWFSLRWYGLLFALGFLLSQQILYYMFKKEGKPQSDVDTLTIYMVVATILGARLGHILFYQPEILWEDPLGVLLPFQFTPTFEFTGLRGLASHGAAFGILFALWLYSNYLILYSRKPGHELQFENEGNEIVKHKIKKGWNFIKRIKPGQSYIQTLDRIVILVTLTGALIRLGNFFNSEIIGKPTDGPLGVVFAADMTRMFTQDPNSPVDFVEVRKNLDVPEGTDGRKPVNIYIFFKKGTAQSAADFYLAQRGKLYLTYGENANFFEESITTGLNYSVLEETPGNVVGRIHTIAIARHPAQLYESISCFIFFLFLMWLWFKGKVSTQPGLIFGVFMVVLWSLRFLYEFIKKEQVDFETNMFLNMGQILSIPLVIVGIIILIRSKKRDPRPGEW